MRASFRQVSICKDLKKILLTKLIYLKQIFSHLRATLFFKVTWLPYAWCTLLTTPLDPNSQAYFCS